MLKLKEPMTTQSDVLLFVLSAIFVGVLASRGASAETALLRIIYYGWGLFFLLNGVTALIGVLDHGYAIGTKFEGPLDRGHATSLGLSILVFLFLGIFTAAGWRFEWYWTIPAFLLFLLFEVVILIRYDYLYFIIYGFIIFAGALVFNVLALLQGVPTWPIIAGILLIFLGGILQALKVRCCRLDHNDLYHVCLIAMYVVVLWGIFDVAAFIRAAG